VFIRGYFLHFFFVSWWFCGYESIMQNKANLLDTQMNVTSVKTKEYENKRLFRRPENKPNQTQCYPLQADLSASGGLGFFSYFYLAFGVFYIKYLLEANV